VARVDDTKRELLPTTPPEPKPPPTPIASTITAVINNLAEDLTYHQSDTNVVDAVENETGPMQCGDNDIIGKTKTDTTTQI